MDNSPSRHHIFHTANTKKDYRGKEAKQFRNNPAFVIRGVPRDLHDSLHLHVPPPPQPNKQEREALLDYLSGVDYEDRLHPFWGLLRAMEYFDSVEGSRQLVAREISHNLMRQLCVLTLVKET